MLFCKNYFAKTRFSHQKEKKKGKFFYLFLNQFLLESFPSARFASKDWLSDSPVIAQFALLVEI